MRARHHLLALLCFVAVMAAACSSAASEPTDTDPEDSQASAEASVTEQASEPPGPDAEPVAGTDLDACELVTTDDVAAATGIDATTIGAGVVAATPNVLSPGHTDCEYAGDWGRILVSLTPEDGANLYDAARGAADDASDREIAGADGAFWTPQNTRGYFWKGSVAVWMQVSFLADGGDPEAIILSLGQAALDRVG